MPTTNSDSSERTRQMRAMAYYAFANQVLVANANGAQNTIRREQTGTMTMDVPTERMQGGCYCSDSRNGIYNFRGGCGCGGTK